jgi:hypothetical protein
MPSVIILDRAIGNPMNLVDSSYYKTILPHVDDDSIFVTVVHEVLLTNSYDSGDFILYGINEIVDYVVKLSQATDRAIKLILSNSCDYKLEYPNFKLNFFLPWTFIKLTEAGQTLNPTWNPSATKALFFMGKPEKIHRVGLLAKLYERKLLDRLEWSFYTEKGIEERCRGILWNYSDYNFKKFLKTCVRSLDPITVNLHYDSVHFLGFTYDVTLYENSCLSIISETEFHIIPDGYQWITEKTWRAIANRHPFVMASSPGTLARLKSFGFRTFENYMLDQEYDQITDENNRLNAIVKNVEYFMNTCHDHIDSIAADVEHNFQLFNDLVCLEIAKLQSFLNNNSNNSNYSEKDTIELIKKLNFSIPGLSAEMRKLILLSNSNGG